MTASQHTPPLDLDSPEARSALSAVYAHLVRLAHERRAEVMRQIRDTFPPEQAADPQPVPDVADH